MKRILSIFLDYKLVITIASFFSIYKAIYILELNSSLIILQLSLLVATFLVYNQNIIFNLLKKNHKLVNLKNEFGIFSIISFFSILILATILITEFGLITSSLFAILFVISIFYNIPITYQNAFNLTIRKLPYLKIFLISFVWAIVSSLIIVKFNYYSLLIFFQYFAFILSITIPFDIRDNKIDKSATLLTLSHKFSDKQLITSSLILLIFNFILSIYLLFIANKMNFVYAEVILFSYLMILISLFDKFKNKKYYYELLDFSIISYGGFYLFFDYLVN